MATIIERVAAHQGWPLRGVPGPLCTKNKTNSALNSVPVHCTTVLFTLLTVIHVIGI